MRQDPNWQFTNYFEKCAFEQTTPNIVTLYIFRNHFSLRLTMWDSYLVWFSSTVKVLTIRLEKHVLKSDHFHHERTVPLWSWGWKELAWAESFHLKWPEPGVRVLAMRWERKQVRERKRKRAQEKDGERQKRVWVRERKFWGRGRCRRGLAGVRQC